MQRTAFRSRRSLGGRASLADSSALRVAVVLLCTTLLLVTAAYMVVTWANAERWPRLRTLDPSLHILGRPAELLRLAADHVGPPGTAAKYQWDPALETRHEALRALLRIQQPLFRITTRPSVPHGATQDCVAVEKERSAKKGTVTLVATPSKDPDWFDTVGNDRYGYWYLEILEFDESGRLSSRRAYPP
jgi:hypothetical protein